MELEIAVECWHFHFVADIGLGACPAVFDLTIARAAVTASGVAVVAILVEHNAVATLRGAGVALAVWLPLAVRRAAVEGQGVAIVEAFGTFDLAVATGRRRACAAVALVPEFEVASGRATIAAHGVTVIAGFSTRFDAVAALGCAGLTGDATLETFLDAGAVACAAIATGRVTVVAFLVAFENAVAALHSRAGAQRSGGANAARTLGLTVGRATVAVLLVAVVTNFTDGGLNNRITAARSGLTRFSWIRTDPAVLKLAGVAAAITACSIAIVAILSGFNALVAALGAANARRAGYAGVGGILHGTGGVTAIIV
jgi:hypothetical protein